MRGGSQIEHRHRAQVEACSAPADGPRGGVGSQLLGVPQRILEIGRRHEAATGAQAAAVRAGAGGTFTQRLAAKTTALHRRHHRVVRLADHLLVVATDRGAQTQQVGAGFEGTHRSLPEAGIRSHGGHVEGIGDEQATEGAAGGAVQQRARPRRDRGRSVAEGGDEHVGGHHGVEPGHDPPGREVLTLELGAVQRDQRQRGVRIGRGGSMAREMLGTGAEPRLHETGGEGARMGGDPIGVVAVGAGADHGVRRVRGDVQHRGEIEVHVAGREHVPERVAGVPGQLDVVGLPQRPGGGQRGAGGRLDAGDVPALLVDGDHAVLGAGMDGSGESPGGLGIGRVVAEEDHGGQARLEHVAHPVGEVGAGERRHEHPEDVRVPRGRAGIRRNARHQSFTAPAVRPEARVRRTSTKKITIGSVISAEAALTGPRSAMFSVTTVRSPTPPVYVRPPDSPPEVGVAPRPTPIDGRPSSTARPMSLTRGSRRTTVESCPPHHSRPALVPRLRRTRGPLPERPRRPLAGTRRRQARDLPAAPPQTHRTAPRMRRAGRRSLPRRP